MQNASSWPFSDPSEKLAETNTSIDELEDFVSGRGRSTSQGKQHYVSRKESNVKKTHSAEDILGNTSTVETVTCYLLRSYTNPVD